MNSSSFNKLKGIKQELQKAAIELDSSLKNYEFSLTYSKRMKGYHSRVLFNRSMKKIEFRLSHKWKDVNWGIQKGAIQALLSQLFKINKNTLSISLLDSFLKKVHSSILVDAKFDDPVLKESFERVNKKFFASSLTISKVRFGKPSKTVLGRYDFDSDEVIISSILKKAPTELLDYVMYHELLHKKHGFGSSLKRRYHTPAFKKDEEKFPNSKEIEKKLKQFLSYYH